MSNQPWRFNSQVQDRTKAEPNYLFVAFNAEGAIEVVTLLRGVSDGKKAAESRAAITGAVIYHIYRIHEISNGLQFERL